MPPALRKDVAVVMAFFAAEVAAAAVVVANQRMAVAFAGAMIAALWLAARRAQAFNDMVVALLAGAIILGYGFANIGVPGPLPIPAAELVLALLVVGSLRWLPRDPQATHVLWFAAAFTTVETLRLIVDYPTWGVPAVRDYTLALEIWFLLVGYRVGMTTSPETITRWLSRVFLIGLPYFALYPWKDQIAAASPTVALQQSVPLFGSYVGAMIPAALGFFYFAIMRKGLGGKVLAACYLGFGALVQSRGLYLIIPLVGASIFMLSRVTRTRLVASLAVASVVMLFLFALAPQGRLGKLSPQFAIAQVKTLTGHTGPGASLNARESWATLVQQKVAAHPHGWLTGVGLGPDLAGGFVAADSTINVRKPHNDYLEIYGRLGLLGLLPFLAVILLSISRIVGSVRRTGEPLMIWILAATGSILLLAATQPFLGYPYATVPLFLLLGIGLARSHLRDVAED